MAKNRFFTNHSKSSALIVSLVIHAVLIVVAISFVAVKVIITDDPTFEDKQVKRPKMPKKKIQIPVHMKKRKPKPRLRKRIVSQQKTFTNIKMPEISGIKGGLGNMGGDNLGSLGFGDLNIGSLFGGNKYMGNELVGTFYDLKQTRNGKPTGMDDSKYFKAVRNFSRSFSESKLKKYYKAPKKKYSISFILPDMPATEAPKVYEAENVQPIHWLCHYKRNIAAPETGRYRFWGIADNIMIVRVKNRLVLDASDHSGRHSDWKSSDERSGKFPMDRQPLIIGDWMRLRKDESVEMEVVIGEFGGLFHAYLLVEQEGKEYKMVGQRPVLPIFKTTPIPEKLAQKMRLNPNKATFDGPTFGVAK
jgi:hypothetical protein